MAVLRWDQAALKIHNQIRALNPWPLARTEFRGQTVQLFQSLPAGIVQSQTHPPGTLVGLTEGGILVQCGENTFLEILQLQVAGRKRVTGRQFASGARVSPGEALFPVTTSE
jgi:methionyl-tRNA formyltransferase